MATQDNPITGRPWPRVPKTSKSSPIVKSADTRYPCPDCGFSMRSIKLIDSQGRELGHMELSYASGEAEMAEAMGRFPIEGKVRARMCQHCGRIVLYGEPRPT